MSITIKTNPTSIDVVGGTDHTFSLVNTENRKATMVVAAGTNLQSREKLSVRTVEPVTSTTSPGGFTSGKVIVDYSIPRTLADGTIKDDSMHLEVKRGVETSDSDFLEMRRRVSQLLLDSEMDLVYNDLVVPA